MNQRPQPLQRNIRLHLQGVFSATGALTLSTPPVPLGPFWEIKQISIKANSALEPTANTYIGINSAGIFISSSFTGNGDTDSQPNVILRNGDSLTCIWAGGTPGAVGQMDITYDQVAG